MTLTDSKFPSSSAFDLIQCSLESDSSATKAAIKKSKAVFGFILKKDGKQVCWGSDLGLIQESWWIDLKDKGEVGRGEKKADVTLTMDDDVFEKLVSGKGNAQNLFMQGKIKIKGNVMKAAALGDVLSKATKTKAKL